METKNLAAVPMPQKTVSVQPTALLNAQTIKENIEAAQKETEIVLTGVEERELTNLWVGRIRDSEKVYKPYYEIIKKARQAYKAEQKNTDFSKLPGKSAYNIFWSGIETQKPFLYFKRPKPYLERVNKIASPVEQVACKILERALEWDLTQFDFDSMAKYVRNDYLISGCGILWETYCPTFKEVTLDEAAKTSVEIKDRETVVSSYVDPLYFIADTTHVGIWEEATWIAKKIFMRPDEIEEQFGQEALDFLDLDKALLNSSKDKDTSVCVYEIWDKATRRVYWIAPDYPSRFLKIVEDPLKLSNFFPCPKPIYATLTNDSLIPVPDFAMIQQMLDELNGITERMRLTMQAIKVSGVYDNAFHKLGDIFEKDITLVSLSDFDKLKSAGGIKGVIDFIPIDQYVAALEALARRRDDVVSHIFEITGVSDIMRGNSNQTETATAVVKKTNFGTLRNQDRQNDMQRFICDLYRLKAEIICEHFSMETLRSFLNPAEGYIPEVVEQALLLLKNEKMRGMLMHIETEALLDSEIESQKTLTGVQTITKLIADGLSTVSAQPLLLPIYRQMIEAVVSVLPHARLFENVLDQAFAAIEKELNKPAPQPVKPEMTFIERLNDKRMMLEYEIEKEKNRLKARELDIKESEARAKVSISEKEMILDYHTKKQQKKEKQNSKELSLSDSSKMENPLSEMGALDQILETSATTSPSPEIQSGEVPGVGISSLQEPLKDNNQFTAGGMSPNPMDVLTEASGENGLISVPSMDMNYPLAEGHAGVSVSPENALNRSFPGYTDTAAAINQTVAAFANSLSEEEKRALLNQAGFKSNPSFSKRKFEDTADGMFLKAPRPMK